MALCRAKIALARLLLPRWLGNNNDEYGAVAAHRTMSQQPPAMDRIVGEVMELTQCTEARARRAL